MTNGSLAYSEAALRAVAAMPWSPLRNRGRPRSELEELTTLLQDVPSPGSAPVWDDVERRLDVPVPTDYKRFIERFGAGTFCDIEVAGVRPSDELGLTRLVAAKYQYVRSRDRIDGILPPFFPEPIGLITWGETLDGWTFCWAPGSDDPDQWGVAVVAPTLSFSYHGDLSFSSFLLTYCGYEGRGVVLGRDEWLGGAQFVARGVPE